MFARGKNFTIATSFLSILPFHPPLHPSLAMWNFSIRLFFSWNTSPRATLSNYQISNYTKFPTRRKSCTNHQCKDWKLWSYGRVKRKLSYKYRRDNDRLRFHRLVISDNFWLQLCQLDRERKRVVCVRVSPIERALCYVIISGYKSLLVGEVAVQIERYRRVNGLFLATRHFGA